MNDPTIIIGGLIVLALLVWWYVSDDEEEIGLEERLQLENFKQSMERSRKRVKRAAAQYGQQKENTYLGRFKAMLENYLRRGGLLISVQNFISVFIVSSVFFTVALWNMTIFPLLPSLILSMGVVGGVLYLYLNILEKRRMKQFLAQFPDALDTITRGVRSGLPVGGQVDALASEFPDPLSGVFRKTSDYMSLGDSLSDALRKVSTEFQLQEFMLFVVALSVQQKTGGNLSNVLETISTTIRQRLDSRARLEAMVSQAKGGAYIIGASPLFIITLLALTQPSHFDPLLNTPNGHTILWLIVALYGLAALSFKFLLRERF
ncbi:MAG: type II secretion system F family protein [Alphaproteobacteria bacterium GM202ARS2]|nr:type II secretion system F family protein [Alphaproteobacteria bacterium GM202ARS2]